MYKEVLVPNIVMAEPNSTRRQIPTSQVNDQADGKGKHESADGLVVCYDEHDSDHQQHGKRVDGHLATA